MTQYENLIFNNLGQFGTFQIFVFLACNLAETPASWSMTMMAFAGASPDWWSVKIINNTGTNSSTEFKQYKVCPSGEYEKIVFSKSIITIVSEWNLVCDRDWIPTFITTMQMVGVLVGAFINGQLGDLIGRKKTFFGVYGGMLLLTLISAFSYNWQMLAAIRFLIGVTLGGFLIISFNLPMEYIGVKWRTFVGCCPFWAMGISLLALFAFLLEDWRKLSLVSVGIGFPLLFTWWYVPESCRWLLAHGRVDEAERVLRRMAAVNKKPVPDLTSLKVVMQEEEAQRKLLRRYSYVDIWKNWEVLRKCVILGFMCFSVVMSYYGFTLGVGTLSGNRYLNLFLSGFVEAVALLIVVLASPRLKRRNTTMVFAILASLLSLCIVVGRVIAGSPSYSKIQTGLAMAAKCSLTASFASLLILMAESFPTVIRNLGYGSCSVAGRIGGVLAPQVIFIRRLYSDLPYIIYGILLLISGLLCLLLQDTYDAPLSDELEPRMKIPMRRDPSLKNGNLNCKILSTNSNQEELSAV